MNLRLGLYQSDVEQEPVDPDTLNVHPLIGHRISQGSFTAQSLNHAQIIQLLQAARCAPSAHNSQPWHFVVIENGPERALIDKDLVQWGAPWAAAAPVLIAVIANTQQGVSYNDINYALFDCGLAVQNLLLQATSMGLAAHPVGYSNKDAVYLALNLQPGHTLILFIALGSPNDQPVETESSRLRKPVSLIATRDYWGGIPFIGGPETT